MPLRRCFACPALCTGAAKPPRGKLGQRLIPERVHSGSGRQGVGDEDMETLDPGGHSARRDPRNFSDLTECGAPGKVVVVGRPIGRREGRVARQTPRHLGHDAAGLEGADRPSEAGAGRIEGRREWSAVRQSRAGQDDVGIATTAPVRGGEHAPRGPAKLPLHRSGIAPRSGVPPRDGIPFRDDRRRQ